MYKLTPEQVHAAMRKDGTGAILREEGIYVVVEMTPDPSWQEIGPLQAAE